jgi:hypothetical protein
MRGVYAYACQCMYSVIRCYYTAYGLWAGDQLLMDCLSWVSVGVKIIKPIYASGSLRLLKTRFELFYWVWVRYLKYVPWLKVELRLRLINGPDCRCIYELYTLILSVICVREEFSKAAFSQMSAINVGIYTKFGSELLKWWALGEIMSNTYRLLSSSYNTSQNTY